MILFPMCLWAHKYYVSTVQMDFSGNTTDISIRIFYDDMENALAQSYGSFLRLCPRAAGDPGTQTDSLMCLYLAGKFAVFTNGEKGEKIEPHFVSSACDQEYVTLHFSAEVPENTKEITIRCDILTEVFPEQRNIIQISADGKRTSRLLSKGRESCSVSVMR